MASKSLYVGNLPHGTNEEELKELFAQWDPADIRLIRDKGFGFVDVADEKAAEAIAALAKAIDFDPHNRIYAVNGKDFAPLRVNADFLALIRH